MNCYRKANWYKPLYVHSDNDVMHDREINAFYVFDETGVIYKRDYGYFENNDGFELDIACVKKVKIDFKCKTAFLISHDGGKYDGLQYDVYIPAFALGLKEPIYEKENRWKRIKKTIKTKIEGFEFEEYKRLDDKLWEIGGEIEEKGKNITRYDLFYELERFENALEQIKKLRKKFNKELERINNYTIEQAIAEGF